MSVSLSGVTAEIRQYETPPTGTERALALMHADAIVEIRQRDALLYEYGAMVGDIAHWLWRVDNPAPEFEPTTIADLRPLLDRAKALRARVEAALKGRE